MKPTRCTSLTAACRPGAPYCPECCHAEYDGSATVNGREYRWTFNPRFGPEFSNSRGRAVTAPRGALWRAFEAWYREAFPCAR